MKPNWRNTITRIHRRNFAWPDGWDRVDAIAAELECSPAEAPALLAEGIRSGDIERRSFPVWDEVAGRKIKAYGYRVRPAADPNAPASPPAARLPAKYHDTDKDAILRLAQYHPDFSPSRLHKYLSTVRRARLTSHEVRQILEDAGLA